MEKNRQHDSRRHFITTGMQLTGGTLLFAQPAISGSHQLLNVNKTYTVQEVINLITKQIPGFNASDTVDTIKTGSPDTVVTGIVTTMFATIDVIKKAIKSNCNFIIAHEPTLYNHRDSTTWVKENEVQQKKLALLNEHNIIIWRAHDSWHAIKPDGIQYGVMKKLNWLSSYDGDKIATVPATPLKKIVNLLKLKLGIKHLRVIGDANQLCKRIAILPGAWGGQEHINTIIEEKPDLLVVGELSEWETAEYIRDARLLGSSISLVVLGHALSEEPGMEWMCEWLQPKIPSLKIIHIASGDPFTWL